MPEFLLEILSEEIPAAMQRDAAHSLEKLVSEKLRADDIKFASVEAFVTPRRLALVVKGLPTYRAARKEEKRGPRIGAPGPAIQGFLKSVGFASLEEAEKRDTDKGLFWFAVITKEGGPTIEYLPQLIKAAISELPWPKSMKWGGGDLPWVRPIKSILALFDRQVVHGAIALGGDMEPISFSNTTQGHRFMDGGTLIVADYSDYAHKLRAADVILDREDRKAAIVDRAKSLCRGAGVDFIEDEALLEEVVGLTERPVPLLGHIDQEFMELPPEVLIVSMRKHQRYFATRNYDGSLSNSFIVVANIMPKDGGRAIVKGNERVLRARLSDAKFFWEQDRRISLESRREALGKIIFHAKLGSQASRVERIRHVASIVSKSVPGANLKHVDVAARLCKSDLVTGMVGEFPELQGTMGRYYAEAEGLPRDIAQAIGEHYSPAGPNDLCPEAPTSVAIAIADKLDSLVGFWAMNEKPTGSRDPYGLRRAALGLVRIILANNLRLSLLRPAVGAYVMLPKSALADYTIEHYEMIVDAFERLGRKKLTKAEETELADKAHLATMRSNILDLMTFITERLKVQVRERGVRHDVIDAVFALALETDLARLLARVGAVQDFLNTSAGKDLLTAYGRAANIVRAEEKKEKGLTAKITDAPNAALLEQVEEKSVASALDEVARKVKPALAAEDFAGAMAAFAGLRGPIDALFDKVTVNVTDRPEIRLNRLKLLNQIRATMDTVADFSKIEG